LLVSIVLCRKTINIALIGDSLVHRACESHDLIGKMLIILEKYNKYYNIVFIDYSSNGAKIHDIREKLVGALYRKPDAFILLWDSDCSDVDESKLDPSEIELLQENYALNLIEVLKDINYSSKFLAVAGPGLLGEAILFKPIRFWGKNEMLDRYKSITKGIVEFYDVQYIDIRSMFLKAIPYYHMYYSGYVTIDGEHENDLGTLLIAEKFADVIEKW
jgi:hypothetical protein